MSSSLLHTEQLSIGYGPTVISDQLDLSIAHGELVCLLGPNGAGKSTLMRTLAGLQSPLAGDIFIEKHRYPLPPLTQARKIAVVLSGFRGIGGIRVEEYVAMGRAPYSNWTGRLGEQDKQQIRESMALTDTSGLAHRNIGTLSDGEQQRVMIARALTQQCPLILLDEPTSHLDIGHRVSIMKLLYSLSRDQGKGILLSSHDLDLALQGADQLWILSDSGAVTTGIPADLVIGGQLSKAYGSGGDAYDWESGGIKLLPAGEHPVHLDIPGPHKRWVLSALSKIGYREAARDESGPIITKAAEDRWNIVHNGNTILVHSVADIVEQMKMYQP